MASVTGIELGPDSCVLVRVRTGRGEPELSAVRVIESAEWPSHDVAVTELLGRVKRELSLPHRARVVVWGLPDSANVSDLASLVALRPIIAAGFKIDSIVSPPKALALLAASRARPGADGAQAWLALNCHGAAIAIVRGGELLVSRTFGWNFGSPFGGPNAQLLQRYSLVAHLAPEVRHAIDMVATSHGVTVELVVTCGDLPELRSLTMPLIEELDIEVETLDSTEGLRVSPRATGDRILESAPALRLACAAAGGPRNVARRWPTLAPPLRMAASVVIVGGLGWLGYRQWFEQAPTRVTPAPTVVGKTAQPQSAPVPGRPSVAAPSVNAARPTGTRSEVPPAARVEPGATPAPAPTPAPVVRSAPPPAITPPPTSVVKSAPPQTSKPVPPAIASPPPSPAARPAPPVVATATPPPAPAKPTPSSSSVARTTAPPVGKPSLPPPAKAVPPAPPAVTNATTSAPSKPASPVAKAGPPPVPTAAARPAPAPGSAVAPKSVPPRVTPPAAGSPPAATIASRPAVPAPPRTAASKPAPPSFSGSAPPAVTAPPVATSAPPAVIPLPPAPMPQPNAPPFVPPLGTLKRDSQEGQSPLSVPRPVEGAGAVNPQAPNPGVTGRYSPSRPVSPVPLKTPVPAVNSILVSPDRRLAVLDGAIVGVGDAVGPRVVVQIEPEAVILREPSGYLIRVSIRGRQVEETRPLPEL